MLAQPVEDVVWKRFHEEDVVCACHPSLVPRQDGGPLSNDPTWLSMCRCRCEQRLHWSGTVDSDFAQSSQAFQRSDLKVPILSFDPYLSLHLQSRWRDSRVEGTSPKVPGNLFIRFSRSCFLIVYLARRISSGCANKGGVVPGVNTILRSRRKKQYQKEETKS